MALPRKKKCTGMMKHLGPQGIKAVPEQPKKPGFLRRHAGKIAAGVAGAGLAAGAAYLGGTQHGRNLVQRGMVTAKRTLQGHKPVDVHNTPAVQTSHNTAFAAPHISRQERRQGASRAPIGQDLPQKAPSQEAMQAYETTPEHLGGRPWSKYPPKHYQLPYGEKDMPEDTMVEEQEAPPEEEQEAPAEPYSAQVIRELHDDHANLLQKYDSILQHLEQPQVRRHVENLLSGWSRNMDHNEALFDKHHEDLPPLDHGVEGKDLDDAEPADSEQEEETSPDEAVEGMENGDGDEENYTEENEEEPEGEGEEEPEEEEENVADNGEQEEPTPDEVVEGMDNDDARTEESKTLPRKKRYREIWDKGLEEQHMEHHGQHVCPECGENPCVCDMSVKQYIDYRRKDMEARELGVEGGHYPGAEAYHEEEMSSPVPDINEREMRDTATDMMGKDFPEMAREDGEFEVESPDSNVVMLGPSEQHALEEGHGFLGMLGEQTEINEGDRMKAFHHALAMDGVKNVLLETWGVKGVTGNVLGGVAGGALGAVAAPFTAGLSVPAGAAAGALVGGEHMAMPKNRIETKDEEEQGKAKKPGFLRRHAGKIAAGLGTAAALGLAAHMAGRNRRVMHAAGRGVGHVINKVTGSGDLSRTIGVGVGSMAKPIIAAQADAGPGFLRQHTRNRGAAAANFYRGMAGAGRRAGGAKPEKSLSYKDFPEAEARDADVNLTQPDANMSVTEGPAASLDQVEEAAKFLYRISQTKDFGDAHRSEALRHQKALDPVMEEDENVEVTRGDEKRLSAPQRKALTYNSKDVKNDALRQRGQLSVLEETLAELDRLVPGY